MFALNLIQFIRTAVRIEIPRQSFSEQRLFGRPQIALESARIDEQQRVPNHERAFPTPVESSNG
jgi:hypothetical protein